MRRADAEDVSEDSERGPQILNPPTYLGLPEPRHLSHAARPGGRGWKVAAVVGCAVAQTRQHHRSPEGGALELSSTPPCAALAIHPWARSWGCSQPCWTLSTLSSSSLVVASLGQQCPARVSNCPGPAMDLTL